MSEDIEGLHEKLDKLLDLFEKAIERFDSALEKSEGADSSSIGEKLDEITDQNAQIADGIVAISEMIKDLHAVKNYPHEPKMSFSETNSEEPEDFEGPKLPPLISPKKRLFKK